MLSRREFVTSIGLGALAWSCGKGATHPTTSGEPLSVTQVSTEVAIGDRRLSFATFNADKTPFEPDAGATVTLHPPSGSPAPPIAARSQRIVLGLGGHPTTPDQGAEVHRIYSFTQPFTVPGVWTLDVVVGKRRGQMPFQVIDRSNSPMIGAKAVASQSPTTTDHRGVEPICTRTPPCPMHDVTIADALTSGKPVVIAFATPKYCTSRTCGPLVDIVENAKTTIGDAARFVHIEIYKDDAAQVTSPTVDEWKIEADPWLYFVGADGKVKDRWSGAVGVQETLDAVKALVAGTL